MADVFAPDHHEVLSSAIARFVKTADDYDNALIDRFGCEPAPETQLTFLKAGAHP